MTPRRPSSDILQQGTLRGRPFRFVRAALLPILGRVVGLRVEGLEHVPSSGAILVVANHLHNADPVLLSVAFPRPLHFMAKKELFAIPVVRWIIRRVGAFPVDRGKADRSAIRRVEATLEAGVPVGMFPEGTRSSTGALAQALPGAALIALRSSIPILPATIVGSETLPFNGTKAVPRTSRPRKQRRGRSIVIRFGPPFEIPARVDDRRLSTEEASELLMGRLAAGLPLEYRGVYARGVSGPTSEPVDEDA